jgi:CheY-like chemotaxis protein
VLADLGIEGEYCGSAVDAVEKVTTQLFQIVITDWEDQPEAAFLLKTARDLKAASRPLTLAIVTDDSKRPEALQAGANSILLKPIRSEQVRDTMSTACELLMSKLPPAATSPARDASSTAQVAVPTLATPVAPPASVTRAPERMRAGELLQSQSTTPSAQFDTESDINTLEEAVVPEVEPVTQLEPTASALETSSAKTTPLTGWAQLQSRLTASVPPAESDTPKESTLLMSYGDPSPGTRATSAPAEQLETVVKKESQPDAGSEDALFAYIS